MIYKQIHIDEVEKYVRIAFDGDNELWEKYHNPDNNFEEIVTNNVKNIKELEEYVPVTCFAIFIENKAIGFSVFSGNLLYSFGINLKHRIKEVLLHWMEWMKNRFDNCFVVALCEENTRAIAFFLRNGLSIAQKTEGNVTLICNNNL